MLLVVNLVATRESPTPDTPTAKMVTELLDHRNAYVASAALILAQAILLLVFVVAIAAVVDRKDTWIGRVASLAGGAASVLAMASAVSLLAAVFTVDHEPTGAAWVPIEFHTFFLASTAVPLAAFLVAVGAAAVSTSSGVPTNFLRAHARAREEVPTPRQQRKCGAWTWAAAPASALHLLRAHARAGKWIGVAAHPSPRTR